VLLVWGEWCKLQLRTPLLQDNSVHSIDRAISIASREELLALDSTSHDVAHQWILLREICREVHLLPLELLPDA
jgi:hypothetical protein